MNNKGITLIELLISLGLVLLLSSFVIGQLTTYSKNAKQRAYNTKVNLILSAAEQYGNENIDSIGADCTNLTIDSLINMGYLNGDNQEKTILIDPRDNTSMNKKIICIYYTNQLYVILNK